MKYRLWDIDINRLFGTFDNEDEALALASVLINSYGDAYAEDLALGCERSDGSFTSPLTGNDLIARVRRVAPRREPRSPRSDDRKASRGKATSDFASASAIQASAAKAQRSAAAEPHSESNQRKTARRKAG